VTQGCALGFRSAGLSGLKTRNAACAASYAHCRMDEQWRTALSRERLAAEEGWRQI
jgi:hypothetical protein